MASRSISVPGSTPSSPRSATSPSASGGVQVGDNSGTIGPAEEYTPIGYEEAAPGGRFLQIGVGVVTRPDDRAFDRFRLYRSRSPIRDAGAPPAHVLKRDHSGA